MLKKPKKLFLISTNQMEIIELNGGIEAVVKKGGFGATPPPGVNPEYASIKS